VLSRDLLVVVIGHRRAVVDAAKSIHGAGIEEQRRYELRLAGAAMTDNGNVSDVGSLVNLHMSNPSDMSADSFQFQSNRVRTSGRHALNQAGQHTPDLFQLTREPGVRGRGAGT
jgi:hypothetical protein